MTRKLAEVAIATAIVALASSTQARAQSGMPEDRRVDLGRQFKASIQERRVLLDAQENRGALPPGLDDRVRKFFEESWSFEARLARKTPALGMLLIWNEVAMQATALDHTNPNLTDPPAFYFGEQFGPPRTARAIAMVHLALDEAVNAISPRNGSYQGVRATILGGLDAPEQALLRSLQAAESPATRAALDRAIVEAAYRSLVGLYPKKTPFLDIAYRLTLREFPSPSSPAVLLGAKMGRLAADAIRDLRATDQPAPSDGTTLAFPPGNPLRWHQDPIGLAKTALGANWASLVRPFLIPSADAFRARWLPGPPAPSDPRFIASYKQVKDLGGDPYAVAADGNRRPTDTHRSGAGDPNRPTSPPPADPDDDQTFVGIYWAYDTSAFLCAPPRLYNSIATSVALRELPIERVEDFAHYLAFLNVTMADAALASWEGKYHFVYPRPITYLREASADGTPAGAADPLWTPLGGQTTNGPRARGNFSPPFPAYPSGHATFGGALFQAMTLYFRSAEARRLVVPTKTLPGGFPDAGIPFMFVSDEYNGRNYGPGQTVPRARVEAHFSSFRQAEKLNADSRIYLGVHWDFDADDGVLLGNAVARDTFPKFIKP